MSEFFPIQIRHLESLIDPICSSDVFPLQVGNLIDGFETRASKMSDVLSYVNLQNQNTNISNLNVSNSAVVSNLLYIGNVNEINGVKFYVDGNAIISGTLSALSGITYFNTNIAQTTALFLSGASGVGLKVTQDFEFPIAQFYDSNNIALHIDGTSERAGNVGIKTVAPNESLTVIGNISSTGNVFGSGLSANTGYINYLSSYNLHVIGSAILDSETNSSLTIGNLVSSKTTIYGDVFINAVTAASSYNTYIGNPNSDIFINGYLFTKNLSSGGNIFINNIDGESSQFNLGNPNSTNNITGTTLLSGNVYIDGNIIVNGGDNDSTFINTNGNKGKVYIGNPLNSSEINSSLLTHNANLTSELFVLNFTEFDALTSNIETLYDDFSIVYLVSATNLLNPSITSVQYRYVSNVEGLKIDLNNKNINLGKSDFSTNINGNVIDSKAGILLNLYTLSGGQVKIGEQNNTVDLRGFNLRINDSGDGVIKNTYVNTELDSGNVELGNPLNFTGINGFNTHINTLSAGETVIGNVSGSVKVYNLTILNSLSSLVDTFNVSNVNSQNIIVSNTSSLNNTNIGGTLNATGDALFVNRVGVGVPPQEKLTVSGNISASGFVSANTLSLNNINQNTLTVTGNTSSYGSTTIYNESNSPALKITHTGSGNVLEIEDQTEDTTIFRIKENGKIIAGTAALSSLFNEGLFNLVSDNRAINTYKFGNNNTSGSFYNYKTRGNNENEHVILNAGDFTSVWEAHVSNGLAYIPNSRIDTRIDPNYQTTASSMPSRINFYTTSPNTTSRDIKFLIDSTGNVGIGTNVQTVTAAPNEKLTVVGNISATGKVYSDNGNSDIWNQPSINLVLPITQDAQVISSGDGVFTLYSPQTFRLTKAKVSLNIPSENTVTATLSSITNNQSITTLTLPANTGFVATDSNLSYLINEDDRITLNINSVGTGFNGAGLKIYLTGRYV